MAGSVSLDPYLTAVVRVLPPQPSAGAAPPSRRSDLGLLRDLQGIVDLDAEVPHRRFQLGVPEEQLNSTQVLGSTVDERTCLSSDMEHVAHSVGPSDHKAPEPVLNTVQTE